MSPPSFFTFRLLRLAIEDDPAILLRSLLQTRKSFNFFLMTTWQSSLYYTNVPLHIRFRKKFHPSFKLFASNPQFISYDILDFGKNFIPLLNFLPEIHSLYLMMITGILYPKLFWSVVKKNVVVIEKNFWNSRPRSCKKMRSLEQFIQIV